MANAKIISFVDHSIRLASEQARSDLDTRLLNISTKIMVLDIALSKLRDELGNLAGQKAEEVRVQTIHAIADNTLNLRHDIKILNDHNRILREDLNALAGALNSLAQELGQLKQDIDQLKQGGGQSDTSA